MKKIIKKACKRLGLKIESSWKHEVQGKEPKGQVGFSNISVDKNGQWRYSNVTEVFCWITVSIGKGNGYSDPSVPMVRASTREKAFKIVPVSDNMERTEFYQKAHELYLKVSLTEV